MVTNLEVLAIIPAYCSTDEVFQQYIRPLGANPLIAYSIAAGMKAMRVTRTLVATESETLAAVARNYGANVPFLLPSGTAFHHADDWTLFRYVLNQLAENQAFRPELVAWLHPFTPIRPSDCVDQAIDVLMANPLVATVHGIIPASSTVLAMWKINPQGDIVSLSNQVSSVNPSGEVEAETTYYQTRHISVLRTAVSLNDSPRNLQVSRPLMLDPRYNVDVSTPFGWEWANWVIRHAQLDMVYPGHQPRPIPKHVELLVLDFDGVMTDNRVWVDEKGHEQIAAYRGDSIGVSRLRKAGVDIIVLSTETNPVVAERCRKLSLPVVQGVSDKASALGAILSERKLDPTQVVYLGNDINDLPCFPIVGCAVVTADAHHNARYQADMVLTQCGGNGAVRELCDLLLHED
jgi:YrbI family 3-deoxy-D-manno-octulosonate 8-phosphate phosphatase